MGDGSKRLETTSSTEHLLFPSKASKKDDRIIHIPRFSWYNLPVMMKSLEMKSELMMDSPTRSMYPSFYVCDEQMSEIAKWEVDGEYTMTVKVRVVSKSQRATVDGTDTDSCLEVLSYEIQK